jgi:hypothetical protein
MEMEEKDALGHSTLGYSDRRLKRKVRACKGAFRRALGEVRPGKRRFAHYDYLQCVYSLHADLKENGVGKKASTRIGMLLDRPIKRNTHLVRTIINATSTGIDVKTASRWSQALRFCWRQRHEWSDLQRFIRANGGIAGCASAFANRKMRGKAQDKGQGDRSEKQPVRNPSLQKSLAVIDRMRRSAANLTGPTLPPSPVSPELPAGTIVTVHASRGLRTDLSTEFGRSVRR